MALFLDLDGTLVEFADSPDAVLVPRDFANLLEGLLDRLDGAVAIVSGRSILAIDQLTNGVVPAVAGLHGAEWRDHKGVLRKRALIPAGFDDAKSLLLEFVNRTRGTLLEDKGAILALHYRRNPDAAGACLQAALNAVELMVDTVVCHGNSVVELRPHLVGKDRAIAAFMEEQPFEGRRPVFVGDDLTDEDGFRFVRENQGIGVLVGPAKMTEATTRLENVPEVRAWLHAALTKDGGARA